MAYLGLDVQKPTKPLKKKSTYIFNKTSFDQIILNEETDERLSNSHLIKLYTHTAGKLSGSGTNGRFKATVTETVTTLTIGGTAYTVKCGEDSEMELIAGCWYTFILDGTTINFKAGGAGLNFKIVGGTTQPTSPKENTIWINTDTAIGEYQFSATQPTTRADGTALQNGDVWIETDIFSYGEFNALKKNGIRIYPIFASQYVSETWVVKNTKIHQNSEWKSIEHYFYKNGFQGIPWIVKPGTGANWSVRTTSFEDDHVLLTTSNSNDTSISGIVSKDKVDMSKYSALVVEFEDMVVKGSEIIIVQLTSIQTDNWNHTQTIAYVGIAEPTDSVTLEFNTTGSYYIDIFSMWGAGGKIKSVKPVLKR